MPTTVMSAQSLLSALEERVALSLRHPTMIESALAGTHAREDFSASSHLLCANNLGSNSAPACINTGTKNCTQVSNFDKSQGFGCFIDFAGNNSVDWSSTVGKNVS